MTISHQTDTLQTSREFSASPKVLKLVRDFTQETLQGWAIHPESIDAAKTIANELATNAIGQSPSAPIKMKIILKGGEVGVGVWDSTPGEPRLKVPAEMIHDNPDAEQLTEDGRGLFLVRALSRRVMVEPHRVGKTVWGVIGATPAT